MALSCKQAAPTEVIMLINDVKTKTSIKNFNQMNNTSS